MKPPQNGKLIYLNEHGRIADNKTNYPMGSFVEVHCVNGTMVKGEWSMLSCIDSGTWDFPLPECIAIPPTSTTPKLISTSTSTSTSTTAMPSTSTTTMKTTKKTTRPMTTTKTTVKTSTARPTTTTSQPLETTKATTATTQCDTVPLMTFTTPSTTTRPKPKPFQLKSMPDKHFWLDLKQLYYYGCNHMKVKPILCKMLKNPANYTDLTQFELPETNDFKHMDQNLLIHLAQAEEMLNFQSDTELNFENLFPFILYGKNDSAKNRMPSTMEHAYRFVLCLYIDTILLDKNLNMTFLLEPPIDDNITQKLKYLLIRITSKVFEDYSQAMLQNDIDLIEHSSTVPTDMRNSNGNITPSTKKIFSDQVVGVDSITDTPVIQATVSSYGSEEQLDGKFSMDKPKLTATKKLNNFDLIVEGEQVEELCYLESLPEAPSNSFISEIKIENETIFNMPDRLYLIGPVSLRTRAYFVCKEGFKAETHSSHYFECTEALKWSGQAIKCEGMNRSKTQSNAEPIFTNSSLCFNSSNNMCQTINSK